MFWFSALMGQWTDKIKKGEFYTEEEAKKILGL